MKRKKIWQKGLSLFLVLSLVLGVTAIEPKAQAAETTTSLPEELKSYTRITMSDFGIEASTEDAGTKHVAQLESSYTGTSLDKTYLDVDVNFHGCTDGNRYFQYLHKSDWSQFARLIHWGTGLSAYEGANSNNSVWMADVANNEFVNLKLAVDVAETKATLKIWVNNEFKGTLEVAGSIADMQKIYIVASDAAPISFRTPQETVETPKTLDDLAEYTKVPMSDFGFEASEDEAGTKYIAAAEGNHTGIGLNKTYLDVDLHFQGATDNGRYIQLFQKADWSQFVRLVHWGTGLSIYEGADTNNSIWVADAPNDEFFNLKIAVNVTSTKVILTVWVNDVLQGDLEINGKVADLANTYIYAGETNPISLRTPTEQAGGPVTPTLQEALDGYTRITMSDFEGMHVSSKETGTAYTGEARGTYTGTTLNKTYLDVDVNFNGTLSNYMHYLAKGDWADYKRIGVSGGGVMLWDPLNTTVDSLWADMTTYGVKDNEFFNLKIRTDIATNTTDSTKEDVTIQLWVNDTYVGESTWTETAHTRNIFYVYVASGSISLRVPTEGEEPGPGGEEPGPGDDEPVVPTISEALKDYRRITVKDFEGLAASTKEAGTKYTAEASGTYKGKTLNKTYLDVDVNFNGTLTNYLHYLAEGNWSNYKRISVSESGLLLWDPFNATPGSLWAQMDTYGVKEDAFFNMKIRTDIATNASDSTKEDVTIQLWVNDTYVGEATWTENAHTRNVLYVYVASGSISLRTPSDGESDDLASQSVSKVLKGYKQVTPRDFAIVGDTFKHGWTEGNWMGYEYPESLNHAYLNVDLALCNDENFHNTIRYLSMDGWQSLQIGIVGDLFQIYETSTDTVLYRVALSDAGISVNKYFNMKLSTDITTNKSNKKQKDVTLMLWINNQMISTVAGEDVAVVKGCTTVGNMLGIYLPNKGTIRLKTPAGAGSTITTGKTEQPDKEFKNTTFGNFAIKDGKYGYIGQVLGANGTYIFSVKATVFSGNFHFSSAFGADFRYGGKKNPWNGLRFWTTGDGKLYMQDATEKTDIYEFHPMYAGVQLVDNMFNMKLSVEFVDSDKDGKKDDVKLGVWFNDVLYKNAYIYLKNYAKYMGNACSIYVQKEDAWIVVKGDTGVDTGVDFTLFGFTKNWKKELGIK